MMRSCDAYVLHYLHGQKRRSGFNTPSTTKGRTVNSTTTASLLKSSVILSHGARLVRTRSSRDVDDTEQRTQDASDSPPHPPGEEANNFDTSGKHSRGTDSRRDHNNRYDLLLNDSYGSDKACNDANDFEQSKYDADNFEQPKNDFYHSKPFKGEFSFSDPPNGDFNTFDEVEVDCNDSGQSNTEDHDSYQTETGLHDCDHGKVDFSYHDPLVSDTNYSCPRKSEEDMADSHRGDANVSAPQQNSRISKELSKRRRNFLKVSTSTYYVASWDFVKEMFRRCSDRKIFEDILFGCIGHSATLNVVSDVKVMAFDNRVSAPVAFSAVRQCPAASMSPRITSFDGQKQNRSRIHTGTLITSPKADIAWNCGSPPSTIASAEEHQNHCTKADIDSLVSSLVNQKQPNRQNSSEESDSFFVSLNTEDDDYQGYPPTLSVKNMELLAKFGLPMAAKFGKWTRVYNLGRDGALHSIFLRKILGRRRTVLVIRTFKGAVFGAYADSEWMVKPGFYGTGNTLLFSVIKQKEEKDKNQESPDPDLLDFENGLTDGQAHIPCTNLHEDVVIYKWTGANNYLQLCKKSDKIVGFGGGGTSGNFGLCVEGDSLSSGSTGPCETFGNKSLADETFFEIEELEVYEITTAIS